MAGTILVGVDDSAPSRAAIRWSVKRASLLGLGVVLAHVIAEPPSIPQPETDFGQEFDASRFIQSESDYAKSLTQDVPLSTLLLTGEPLASLATAARRSELVVVGTHKTGFVRGRVFGSRFAGLGMLAQTDAAFIPDLVSETRRQIVAGVEDGPVGLMVARFAAAEASRSARELTLILDSSRTGPGSQAFAEAAITGAKSVDEALKVRARWSGDLFAESLIEASTSAALLVIADRPREVAPADTAGVTHDVLLNIASPTLVVFGGRATSANAVDLELARA